MPPTPYIVSGTVYNSSNTNISNVIITFTNINSNTVTTNSIGRFVFDLAEIDYSDSDTITYSAEDEFKNEIFTGTFVVSGASKTLNITLSVKTKPETVAGNRDTQLYNIGGKPISGDNPLPVTLINTVDLIDLTNNPDMAYTYDTKGRILTETATMRGDSYRRTFSYVGNNFNPSTRSKWVRI